MSETEIHRVLDFWFSGRENDSPKIDARMDRWFGDDPALVVRRGDNKRD